MLHRVCVVIPAEDRLVPVHNLFTNLGFVRFSQGSVDRSGMWGGAQAGQPQRQFVELALPYAGLLPLLMEAQKSGEGVKPPP